MKNYELCIILVLFLLAGCGGGGMDVHDVDREPKPYESVQVGQLGADALLSHLPLPTWCAR